MQDQDLNESILDLNDTGYVFVSWNHLAQNRSQALLITAMNIWAAQNVENI
jgi:hypothetical protein